VASVANAELQTWCEAFADRQGAPRAPCAFIVAAIGANAELSAERFSGSLTDPPRDASANMRVYDFGAFAGVSIDQLFAAQTRQSAQPSDLMP